MLSMSLINMITAHGGIYNRGNLRFKVWLGCSLCGALHQILGVKDAHLVVNPPKLNLSELLRREFQFFTVKISSTGHNIVHEVGTLCTLHWRAEPACIIMRSSPLRPHMTERIQRTWSCNPLHTTLTCRADMHHHTQPSCIFTCTTFPPPSISCLSGWLLPPATSSWWVGVGVLIWFSPHLRGGGDPASFSWCPQTHNYVFHDEMDGVVHRWFLQKFDESFPQQLLSFWNPLSYAWRLHFIHG